VLLEYSNLQKCFPVGVMAETILFWIYV